MIPGLSDVVSIVVGGVAFVGGIVGLVFVNVHHRARR
jgi:prolipoprotein diacylglyceryltransferase